MKNLILLGIVLFIITALSNAQHRINGYVVSLESAQPIANATVFLTDQYGLQLEKPLRVTSDSTGFYSITGIKEGTDIINAWTTYRAMDQRYAMVIASDRIEIDHSRNIDFVFSENAFKFSLHYKHNPLKAFDGRIKRPDDVTFQAVRPQIYINSKRDTVGATFIEEIEGIN